ncbi:MAG: 50S ribosome-binding GTPase [Candidatus Dormibacteraeota bacterium]|nr:50S ribosome-binding GTPase [Candidatus Dormibacteraeota bacterium]MBO0761601.1 50S ribosome-binding GTPase [Candidatus Dormibacteraeota bacterium]
MTDLLRFATAGSVDDGKSTLVGRLLYDSKSVLVDQLAALERASRDRGLDAADLALLTDGLRAEREQGITIDVAYRYFATPRRRFTLADTPGHVQYTRNMVSGASNADLVVVLVDVRNGVVEQTRRHITVTALLRVPQLVAVVNKLDLVGYEEAAFREAERAVARYATALGIADVRAIPVSALQGDNVVERSDRMGWYRGPALLEHLEQVPLTGSGAPSPARFPVQYVLRPGAGDFAGYRGYAGQVASGVLRTGDPVLVLPAGHRTTVAGIDRLGERDAGVAAAGESVTIRLAGALDVARGDLIVADRQDQPAPRVTQDVEATLCWLAERPLRGRERVLVKHTTRVVPGLVTDLRHRLDIETVTRSERPPELAANEIGGVALRTASPLVLDPYAGNPRTGALLLIDPQDGSTLAAGMVGDPLAAQGGAPGATEVTHVA